MKYCNLNPRGKRHVALTFDVDWAPDFAIEFVLKLLGGLKATMFFTHPTPLIAKIRKLHPNVELGYHPNFFPGGTQGATEAEIMEYGRRLLKKYGSIRTHCLLNSSRHYELYAGHGIRCDSSFIMFKTPYLVPYMDGRGILRIPIFWEDDTNADAGGDWNDLDRLLRMPGLKVFNFHPLYLYMDVDTLAPYRALKKDLLKRSIPLNRCTEGDAGRPRHKTGRYNLGFFTRLLSKTSGGEIVPYRLDECVRTADALLARNAGLDLPGRRKRIGTRMG